MREGLIILGTFLPAIGLAATALLATRTRGVARWGVVVGVPALTSVVSWLVVDPVWSNGNLLAAAVYMSFYVTMIVYYPALLVIAAVMYLRARRRPTSDPTTISAGVIVLAILGGPTAQAQDAPALPAPLQVEAVTRESAGRTTSDGNGAPRVVVNLGGSEGKAWPTWEHHASATLLGTDAAIPAQLVQVVKVCETLCGDESEECHYEARYAPRGVLEMIGTPVAALLGDYLLSEYTVIPQGTPLSRRSIDDGLSAAFVEAIWPEENPAETRYRFRRAEDEFVLEYAWGDRGGQTVPANACRFQLRGPFERMVCDGIEALVADRTPLLVSFPDYNSPDVDVLASFTHGAQTYYVARLALKAQTVHGLVYRDGDQWRAKFHPRDYALLC